MRSHLRTIVILLALGACSGSEPVTGPDPAEVVNFDPMFDVTAPADGGTCPDVYYEHTELLGNGATVTWTNVIAGFDYDLSTDYLAQIQWSVEDGSGAYVDFTTRNGPNTWTPRSGNNGSVDGMMSAGVPDAGSVPITVSMDPMKSVGGSGNGGDDPDDWSGWKGSGHFWLRLDVENGEGEIESVKLGVNFHFEDPADGFEPRCPGTDPGAPIPPPPPPSSPVTEYTVGGTMSGLTGTVSLLNNGGNALSVSSNGSFTFLTSLGDGAAYAVTVGTQPDGQTCEVTSGSGTIASANVTDVSVACSDVPPPPPPPPAIEYTVGGTMSGLTGTVSLLNNGGDALSVSSNGSFTFLTSLGDGAAYAVTVGTQPDGQTCEVTSGSGTIASANVMDVSVACSDVPPPPPPPPPSSTVFYAADIQPYFNSNCTSCHQGNNPPKGVNLTSYEQLVASDVVVPSDPNASVLVQQLEDGHRSQSASDITMIRTWIQEGAQKN